MTLSLSCFVPLILFHSSAHAAEPEKSVAEIQAKLRVRRDFKVDGVPPKEFVAELSKQVEVAIRLDQEGLKRAAVSDDTPVTADFQDMTVSRALLGVLGGMGLEHAIRDGEVVISNAPVKPAPPPVVRRMGLNNGAVRVRGGFGQGGVVRDEAHFIGQFRLMLTAELNVVKRVCEPADDQWRALEQDGEDVLKAVARHFVDTGGRRFVPRRGPVDMDPRAEIRQRLIPCIEARLTMEQAKRFAREVELRTEHRKRVAAFNLVTRLDEQLFLSTEQREAICNTLTRDWPHGWDLMGPVARSGPSLPLLPDQLVVPHLNERQQAVWQTTPKTSEMPVRMMHAAQLERLKAQQVDLVKKERELDRLEELIENLAEQGRASAVDEQENQK